MGQKSSHLKFVRTIERSPQKRNIFLLIAPTYMNRTARSLAGFAHSDISIKKKRRFAVKQLVE